jgi:hypothetical protein
VLERETEIVRTQLKRNGLETVHHGLARFADPHTTRRWPRPRRSRR